MALLMLKDGDALAVVVVDDSSEQDVKRLLQQAAKTTSPGTELVLLTQRSIRFPLPVARRLRVVRTTTGAALENSMAAEVAKPKTVVVMTATSSLSQGWAEEVAERAALFPTRISQIEAQGPLGLLVYPPMVTAVQTDLVPWLSAKHVRVRGVAGSSSTSATTISAVMIVKNEEAVLEECLTAVAPFVDEIIVYDTGSTDSTMEIARRHGARVIEGYWNDHFGDARNRALDHATMEWVLQVDADEVASGDPVELRARLAAEERNLVSVSIVSSAWQGVGTGLVTHPVRIFRRESSRYVGALHEHPRPLDPKELGHNGVDAPIKLMHSGYNLSTVMERNKPNRNVDIARRELESLPAGSEGRTEALSNLARSLVWASRFEEAGEVFSDLRVTPGSPSAMVAGGRNAFDFLLTRSQFDEAEAWLEVLAAHGEVAGNLATMRARLLLCQGDAAEAAKVLAKFHSTEDNGRDPWGLPYDRSRMLGLEAEMMLGRGELHGGIEALLSLAKLDAEAVNLDLLLRALVVAGRPLTDLAGLASEALIARSIREGALFHPSGALAWFDALHQTHPDDVRPIVAGSMFAARSDWSTAMTWSVRARERELNGVCALQGLGENAGMPVMERTMAWLVLAEVLGDAGARTQLRDLIPGLPDAELEVLRSVADVHGIDTQLLTREVNLSSSERVTTS